MGKDAICRPYISRACVRVLVSLSLALNRTGNSALGDFADAIVIVRVGEVGTTLT